MLKLRVGLLLLVNFELKGNCSIFEISEHVIKRILFGLCCGNFVACATLNNNSNFLVSFFAFYAAFQTTLLNLTNETSLQYKVKNVNSQKAS